MRVSSIYKYFVIFVDKIKNLRKKFKFTMRKKRILSTLFLFIFCIYTGHQRIVLSLEKRKDDIEPFRIENLIDNSSIQCSDITKPDAKQIKIVQNRWQMESSKKGKVYLYSAFYDDRPLAGSPFVRINLMATHYPNITIFCHFWHDDCSTRAYVQEGFLNQTGLNRGGFKEGLFLEYILSCPVPISKYFPKYVSVTEEEPCKSLTTLLPVIYEYHKEPPIEFGVCVVNGHGKFTPQEMVEWFEFYRLMGVEEFNLYNTSYKGVDDVLEYYVEDKTLILNQIPHPLGPGDTVTKIRNLRSTCLNDCMMRNMYRYRYLVVVDHDEFIVPRGNITNYHDLIQESEAAIQAKEEIMSIGFVNTYFFKTFQPDLYKPSYLRTFQFRHRTKPLVPYTASKSILKPKFCFNLMNHYCYTTLPRYKGRISYFSPTHLAMSHHYRLCGIFTGTKSCSRLHGEKTADDTILKFETSLKASVENILSNLSIPIRL